MRVVRRALGVGTAVALAVSGTALTQTASAVALSCGAVVTANTTLTADVGPCASGQGITVNANNVTLNLNGHRIFGVAANNGTNANPYIGVYVTGRTGVTITNGRISDFDTGVYLEFGGSHTISRMHIFDNIGGLNGDGFFGEGIQLFESDNNAITASQVIHNGTFAGIDVFDSHNTRITGNTVQGNNVVQTDAQDQQHGPTIMQDIGIFLVTLTSRRTTGTVVTGNQVQGNGLDGISVGNFTTNNQVLNNSVQGNGVTGQVAPFRDGSGIRVGSQATGNLVQGNRVQGNGADGISIVNGSSNTIRRNQSFGNNLGPNTTIANFDLFDSSPTCASGTNTWTANAFATKNRACIS